MKPGMRRPAAWALGAVLLVAVESGCRRGRSEPAMPAKPMRYEEAPAPLPEGDGAEDRNAADCVVRERTDPDTDTRANS